MRNITVMTKGDDGFIQYRQEDAATALERMTGQAFAFVVSDNNACDMHHIYVPQCGDPCTCVDFWEHHTADGRVAIVVEAKLVPNEPPTTVKFYDHAVTFDYWRAYNEALEGLERMVA